MPCLNSSMKTRNKKYRQLDLKLWQNPCKRWLTLWILLKNKPDVEQWKTIKFRARILSSIYLKTQKKSVSSISRLEPLYLRVCSGHLTLKTKFYQATLLLVKRKVAKFTW